MTPNATASALRSRLDPAYPLFVLIDPMLGEPIIVDPAVAGSPSDLAQARECAWRRPTHVVALAPTIELPMHQHPYVVELHGLADEWLDETVRLALQERDQALAGGLNSAGGAPHRIGGWLQSSLWADQLALALSNMMKVSTQARTNARYQRLADRRTLGWLRQVVGDARVVAPFGRIQSWSYLDACGDLTKLQSTSEATTPLRLTATEWATFMQGELLHPTVARWLGMIVHRQNAENLTDVTTAYRRAVAALERADTAARRWPRRFTEPADRVAWAVLTLLHPKIDHAQDVADLLGAADPDEPVIETLNALSPVLDVMSLKATTA